MPQENIERMLGIAVVSEEFRKQLLNPRTRVEILNETEGLEQDERRKMFLINAQTFQEFAQACIDLELVDDWPPQEDSS